MSGDKSVTSPPSQRLLHWIVGWHRADSAGANTASSSGGDKYPYSFPRPDSNFWHWCDWMHLTGPESQSWLRCCFFSDGSRRVVTSICSVSSRMHKANSCLLFTTMLCEKSRSEAQRCYVTVVPAKPWHFPITARIVFSPPAVPMPVKEKLLDERLRCWLRPNTWSWELILGRKYICQGNTLKSQPL